MNKEEAIKELKERVTTLKRHIKLYEESDCKTNIYQRLIIEKQAIETVLTELEKKNKIIDAMAIELNDRDFAFDYGIKDEELYDGIIEYFEKKVGE